MSSMPVLTSQRIIELFPHLRDNNEAIEELIDYEADLSILARHNISIQFNNSGKEHAAIVMSKLFDHSFNHVKIFAGDFNGQICDNELYFEAVNRFVSANKKLEIVFESDPNRGSHTFNFLFQKSKETNSNVSISKAAPQQVDAFKALLVNNQKTIHFAIGNNDKSVFNKYRCETDTENYIAILNFDDSKFSAKLNQSFDVLKRDAISVN